ncbi:unnamed protein product [Sphagnum jensenii]|uniref:Uncharacterized protein n=1 Tax=Sphagnum jensenii TaxID=128206 RepID=A0ABP1AZB3_9BRYO
MGFFIERFDARMGGAPGLEEGCSRVLMLQEAESIERLFGISSYSSEAGEAGGSQGRDCSTGVVFKVELDICRGSLKPG